MSATFRKYILFFTACALCLNAFAQSSQETFGKNRVQYKNFDWKYISTTNFEIYYYGNSSDLAIKAGTYAEESFPRITNLIGYMPDEKVKIILYTTVSDKIQSNIGLANQEIMIGGQTVLVKTKIEIAFKGTQTQLIKDIRYGISYTLINTIMYGGSIKDVVRSSYLLNLPEWYINGASAYLSEGWSQEMDNFMRDKSIYGKIKNPANYANEDAKLIGQSIWNFISEEYGENNISGILTLTRAFRNERQSIESSLGISYSDFLKNWESYYKNINSSNNKSFSNLTDSTKLVKGKKNVRLYSLKMNKDGSLISYVQNNRGRYKLKILTVQTGKKQTVAKGGYKRVDQAIDFSLPASTWQNDFTLTAIIRKRDNLYLKNFDLKNRKTYKRKLPDYRQIYSISYAPDENQLLLSADKTGQTDIFNYNSKTNTTTQITNDAYDDLTPIYTNTNAIIFSSNRTSDTLNSDKELPNLFNQYNLFEYSTATKNNLTRLTSKGSSYMPVLGDSNLIYFLNNEKGITTLNKLNTDGNSFSQLSNIQLDISNFSFSYNKPLLSFICIHNGKETIHLKKGNWNSTRYATSTAERVTQDNPFKKQENSVESDTVNFNFNANDELPFENLIFESEVKKTTLDSSTSKPTNAVQRNPLRFSGPKKYQNPFSADKVVSTLMIDPIRGLGMSLEGGMSDLMGNHRIDAGGFIAFDFRSSKLFCEYRYVKRRFDFKTRFERQSLNPSNDYSISQRYILNTFGATVSYPLSVTQRLSITPYLTTTTFRETTYISTIAQKDQIASYESIRGEYVFDNSLVTGINMLKGTRFKISLEFSKSNQSKQQDFGLFGMDFRKYIPIHKELVFATRISYGYYFGNAPKNFLLGGMDNWLLSNREFYSNTNAQTQNPLALDPGVNNSDILFARYATSLRGFKYNSQFGSKYLLLNGELRIPIVKYLYKGSVSSNFFRNLQLIGFTDIGTAYSGNLSTQNTINSKTVTQYPFKATVTNYLNPFLIGFGGGFRTMFLGYYIKMDLGWGLQNNYLSKAQLYITLGYDF